MDTQNENNPSPVRDQDDAALPVTPSTIGWATAAFVVAIISVTFNNSAMVISAGFFAKLMAVLVGTALGLGGALLGNAIRKFAHPDAVFTQGGMLSLIWIRVFWAIGPQVIGLIAGVMIGCAMVLR
ncbi:hypothetical protein DMO17_02610 [Aquipseudomonas alcaligenes]|uniref:Permease n=1 Tax=Aquipseudomonas alcaligenes TaxID=43263 RepID=A0A2V4MHU2_AQUAC|nr:hypothetical protein [Pseudomonas alcaligenes]PYC29606.1 hypothetical protein DMO17_02610 [Pseudomonas alcaligenes]